MKSNVLATLNIAADASNCTIETRQCIDALRATLQPLDDDEARVALIHLTTLFVIAIVASKHEGGKACTSCTARLCTDILHDSIVGQQTLSEEKIEY